MASGLLDLHGCREEDVEARVDRFIVQAVDGGLPKVKIMTGKGKGIVLKAVTRYLKLAGYSWKFDKGSGGKLNEGVLLVQLL